MGLVRTGVCLGIQKAADGAVAMLFQLNRSLAGTARAVRHRFWGVCLGGVILRMTAKNYPREVSGVIHFHFDLSGSTHR